MHPCIHASVGLALIRENIFLASIAIAYRDPRTPPLRSRWRWADCTTHIREACILLDRGTDAGRLNAKTEFRLSGDQLLTVIALCVHISALR